MIIRRVSERYPSHDISELNFTADFAASGRATIISQATEH